MSGLKLIKYECYFHPLEVVGRGSETQLQGVKILIIFLAIWGLMLDTYVRVIVKSLSAYVLGGLILLYIVNT